MEVMNYSENIELQSIDCVVEEAACNISHLNADGYNFTGNGVSESLVLFFTVLWVYVTPIIFSLISIVGTIGNSLVIYVILSNRKMRTFTNMMLLNLAIADISFLLICVPFTAYKFAADSWPFGDVICKVVKYFLYVTSYVTVYTLVAISVLRYVTIVCHGTYMYVNIRTNKSIIITCIMVWFILFMLNIPVILIHQVKHIGDYSYCGLEKSAVESLFVTFFVFAYVVPLLIICFLYLLIIYHLKSPKATTLANGRAKQRTAKASRLIIIVVFIFGLSWLPLHINSLVALYGRLPDQPFYEVFRILWNCMAYGNSCANPIIYNYSSTDFRKGFHEVITCLRYKGQKRHTGRDRTFDPTETTIMVETRML